MTSRPWMPLYVADYRADTAHLSAAEHGAYLLLIMHYWVTGGLPKEDGPLARIACMSASEWKRARGSIAPFFTSEWTHKRIDEEIAHAEEISSKRRASAQQRHSKRNANAEQLDTQSQSQSQEEEKIGADAPDDGYAFEGKTVKLRRKSFDDWVRAYPNLDLIGELTARDAWLSSDRATDADRKRWFVSTSQHLANRNMQAKAKVVAMKPDGRPMTKAEELYREGIV